ncbi:MAG: hypothetical protein WBE26_07490 [Phycisphaerae bacterium]
MDGHSLLRVVAVSILATCFSSRPADGQANLTITDNGQETELRFGTGDPFHVTSNVVDNVRIVEIPASPVLLSFWDERDAAGTATPHYAISLDGRDKSGKSGGKSGDREIGGHHTYFLDVASALVYRSPMPRIARVEKSKEKRYQDDS